MCLYHVFLFEIHGPIAFDNHEYDCILLNAFATVCQSRYFPEIAAAFLDLSKLIIIYRYDWAVTKTKSTSKWLMRSFRRFI